MNEEKFKVIQLMKEFISIVEKEVDNFPRKDIEIKSKLRNNCYEVLELLFEANIIDSNEIRKQLLSKAIAKIKIIDYLINLSYEKKLITEKKYIRLGVNLNELIKYISGWLKKYVNSTKMSITQMCQ